MTVYEWAVRQSWRINERVLKWTLALLAIAAVPFLVLLTYHAAATGIPGTAGVNPWVPTAALWLIGVPLAAATGWRRMSSSTEDDGDKSAASPGSREQS